MPKWEAGNGLQIFLHHTCCNLEDVGGQENWSKMKVQMAPPSHQNWSIGRPRCVCFRYSWIGASLFLFFYVFGGCQKAAPKNKKNRLRAKSRAAVDRGEGIIIQIGSLSSGSGHFGWFYILLFDNAWHQLVSADFGTHWILKGSPNRQLLSKTRK